MPLHFLGFVQNVDKLCSITTPQKTQRHFLFYKYPKSIQFYFNYAVL